MGFFCAPGYPASNLNHVHGALPMNTVHLRRSDPTVDRIVRAVWPAYNGQNVTAHIRDTVRFYGTNWDEGRKKDYAILRLADMQRVPIADAPFLQHSELHERDHKIPD